jgi:exopolysaccharide production protein ExoQ
MNRTIYKIVLVSLLLTLMGVVMGIESPGLADTDLGVVGNQVHLPVLLSTFALYSLVLSRLVLNPRRYLQVAGSMRVLLPMLLFCALSAGWSTDPSLSIRRTAFLVFTVLIAFIVGVDFEVAELVKLFTAATLIHIALCGVFYVVAKHYLYAPEDTIALKGLTTHKNIFGLEMGLGLVAVLTVPLSNLRWARWPVAAIVLACLVMSHSSGSLVATVAALAIWPLLQVVRLRSAERLPLTAVAVTVLLAAGAALFMFASAIPALFSKDATLTGRTQLWSLIGVAIHQHPWLGYGYDSFWQGLQGDSLTIIRGVGWLVPTAHNGYLDLMLSVGICGAALFLPVILQGVARSMRYAVQESSTARFFPAMFLVLWFVYNLNESALLTRNGVPFFLFVTLGISIAAHRRTYPQYAQDSAPALPAWAFASNDSGVAS